MRNRFDARENRLTAAVVAALTQSRGLRADLINDLWKKVGTVGPPELSASDRSEVVPQRPVFPPGKRACFVDIEIVVAERGIKVWVEAKVASGLSGQDQLAKYATALKAEVEDHKLLVLLAPVARQIELERELPRGSDDVSVTFASWSDVHRVFTEWRRSSASDQRGRWLIAEVMTYMSDQGHGSVKKLNNVQCNVVNSFEIASTAVLTLFNRTSALIKPEWPEPRRTASRSRDATRWEGWAEWKYRPYPSGAGKAALGAYRAFAFNFETPPLRFGAGVYFNELSDTRKVAVKDYALKPGWECDVNEVDPWLWRFMDTEELLDLPDLEAQATRAKEFALETFSELHSSPPDRTRPRQKR